MYFKGTDCLGGSGNLGVVEQGHSMQHNKGLDKEKIGTIDICTDVFL